MDEVELRVRLQAHGARLRPKSRSRFMRLLGLLLRGVGNRSFMDEYWTTIGCTIYYPTRVDDPYAHRLTLEHELVHVRQWKRWGLLFSVSYVLLPVPVGFAWWRWRWEREAYLVQLAAAPDPHAAADLIARRLFADYGWPWPRAWMRRWFEARIASGEVGRSAWR